MVGPSLDATAASTAKLLHRHHYLKPSSSSSIKFLCSYGGKIIPRYPDGKLRYHGGETRVLSVHRTILFSELLTKMGELCGAPPVSLRCQLPAEDLDALVSITSDEDLTNLIEEYDRAAAATPIGSLKIRAFLSPPKKMSTFSPPTLASSSSSKLSSLSSSSSSSSSSLSSNGQAAASSAPRCYHHQVSKPVVKRTINPCYGYHFHGNPSSNAYLVHNGSHWQWQQSFWN